MTSETAGIYRRDNRKQVRAVSEIIAHLGEGKLPDSGPVGVNMKYFPSRALELNRLIANKKLLQSESIKLTNYSILKK